MSVRDDFFSVLSGEQPECIPLIYMGFWDESSMRRLAPPGTVDENTYCYPGDYPPRDRYSSEPRTTESRQAAVQLARYLGMSTIGVGKGGVLPFGHGGPGEIIPVVAERTPEHKILTYEGGHQRIIHYNPHSVHYYNFPVATEADLETLQLPDMKDPKRFGDVLEDCRFFKAADLVPTGSIQGFFSGLHNSFMDFVDTLANLLLEPVFMEKFISVLAHMNLDAVDMLLERGVEVIDVCDDFGNEAGMLLSPALVRKFFIPWYEELADRVHAAGAYVHLHSHGNISMILEDLAHIGIDIINPFDRSENPDLEDLVRRYGDRIIFCGGSARDQDKIDTEERKIILHRACSLSDIAGRGYMYMLGQPAPDIEKDLWDSWLDMTRASVCRDRH